MHEEDMRLYENVKILQHCCSNRRLLERGRGDFGDGEFEDKAGANGGVILDAEESVMLGNHTRGDSEAEAGAAIFGGEMGKEELVLVGWGDAMAGVFDGDFDGFGFG